MTAAQPAAPCEPTETIRGDDGVLKREVWALPPEAATLEAFLRDVFENHWSGIRFGPLIEGAAYEWKCPAAPQKIGLMDGYLTVMFGNGGHFHLCIGENLGSERFRSRRSSPDAESPRRRSCSGVLAATAGRSPGASRCGTGRASR